jgi:hypothetical protein
MRAIASRGVTSALALAGCFGGSAIAASGDSAASQPSRTIDAEFSKACATMARRDIRVPECVRAQSVSSKSAIVISTKAPSLSPKVPLTADPVVGGAAGAPFFILRQDQYDQVSYVLPELGFQVIQGASFSYTNDQKAKTQSANAKAFAGYSAYNWKSDAAETSCGSNQGPGFLARYGTGPFVMLDGTFNEPTTASEKSALRGGINLNPVFCDTAIFQKQDFQFMPYAQTDFRGKASIAGFDALWEPYYIDDLVHLGGRSDVYHSKIVGYYFRVLGEANVFNVNDSGLTNFQPRTAYALLGGTLEARAVLFENNPNVPAALCGTISMIGSARYLWDAVSGKSINYYGAEIDYKIGGKSASTTNCKGADPSAPNSVGNTSLALSYNTGTNPTTFVAQNLYKASLKFSY